MKKEMQWAKVSMEKHYKSKGHLPLRSKVYLADLYPRPDVDYDKDDLIDQDSSSADDGDLNSLTFSLEPDEASNNLRRRNIRDERIQKQNRTRRMESSDYSRLQSDECDDAGA
jgi:hypothetical protein